MFGCNYVMLFRLNSPWRQIGWNFKVFLHPYSSATRILPHPSEERWSLVHILPYSVLEKKSAYVLQPIGILMPILISLKPIFASLQILAVSCSIHETRVSLCPMLWSRTLYPKTELSIELWKIVYHFTLVLLLDYEWLPYGCDLDPNQRPSGTRCLCG